MGNLESARIVPQKQAERMENKVKITDEIVQQVRTATCLFVNAITLHSALEFYEEIRPKDGFTLGYVEDAVIRVCLRCGVGQAFKEELMNELAPKPRMPEERVTVTFNNRQGSWMVLRDNKIVADGLEQEVAHWCKDGLIAALREEAERVPRA